MQLETDLVAELAESQYLTGTIIHHQLFTHYLVVLNRIRFWYRSCSQTYRIKRNFRWPTGTLKYPNST